MAPYPFHDAASNGINGHDEANGSDHSSTTKSMTLKDCRGRTPSLQASKLRTMLLESWRDPTQILATCCADDTLSARLIEEAGYPVIFLGGYAVAASLGLPDTVLVSHTFEGGEPH